MRMRWSRTCAGSPSRSPRRNASWPGRNARARCRPRTRAPRSSGSTSSVARQRRRSRPAWRVGDSAAGGIKPLIQGDIAEARRLDKSAHRLAAQFEVAGDKLAQATVEKLYNDTRRVLDKAKLGKIDAIIGQKRKLDIEVQDLAAGRFPEELIGKLWNASMIGDDEEYWPWQGEYWADEYEGWR